MTRLLLIISKKKQQRRDDNDDKDLQNNKKRIINSKSTLLRKRNASSVVTSWISLPFFFLAVVLVVYCRYVNVMVMANNEEEKSLLLDKATFNNHQVTVETGSLLTTTTSKQQQYLRRNNRQLTRPRVIVNDGNKYIGGETGTSCRNENGLRGIEGVHYFVETMVSSEEDEEDSVNCFELCNDNDNCYGFELIEPSPRRPSAEQRKCHIWMKPISSFMFHNRRRKSNRSCYQKVKDDGTRHLLKQKVISTNDIHDEQQTANDNRSLTTTTTTSAEEFLQTSRTSLLPRSTSSATTSSSNNNCPEPNTNGFCPMVYRPVTCSNTGNNNKCNYTNRCFAALAGFKSQTSDCTEQNIDNYYNSSQRVEGEDQSQEKEEKEDENTCPKLYNSSTNNNDASCPYYYNPVQCSNNNNNTNDKNENNNKKCNYMNICFAKLAGWKSYSCNETCPTVPLPPAPSTVTSRSSSSSSNIFSQASTWFHNTEPSSPTATVTSARTSGSSSELKACGIHNTYNPVFCHLSNVKDEVGCIYQNFCIAEQTTIYHAKRDCQMYCPSPLPPNDGSSSTTLTETKAQEQFINQKKFPPPTGVVGDSSSSSSTTMNKCLSSLNISKRQPVVCGLNQCQYQNICLATIGAGYDEDQCMYA